MYDRQRALSDEEVGIRAFKIRQAKAVERATERIRAALGDSWSQLTDEEIEELEWVLGELWAYAARDDWDDLRFGRLTVSDIVRILTLGSQLRRHARNSVDILRDVKATVDAVSPEE